MFVGFILTVLKKCKIIKVQNSAQSINQESFYGHITTLSKKYEMKMESNSKKQKYASFHKSMRWCEFFFCPSCRMQIFHDQSISYSSFTFVSQLNLSGDWNYEQRSLSIEVKKILGKVCTIIDIVSIRNFWNMLWNSMVYVEPFWYYKVNRSCLLLLFHKLLIFISLYRTKVAWLCVVLEDTRKSFFEWAVSSTKNRFGATFDENCLLYVVDWIW